MAAGGFLRRWAARKAQSGTRGMRAGRQDGAAPAAQLPAQPAAAPEKLPTLEDVRQLAPDADYSRFLSRGIDPAVRRAALKTLFSDPHFQRMDGLDVYIGDYTWHAPLTPAMLAALQHARGMMGRAHESGEQENAAEAALPLPGPPATPGNALQNDDTAQDHAASGLGDPAAAPASLQDSSMP